MALNIYTSRKYIPAGMELIENIGAFFDFSVSITDCPTVRKVLEEVDHSKWYSPSYFTSRFEGAGNVSFSCLSNGGKTVLCTYYYPEKCFTLRSCAYNAAKLIWEFDRGNVFMPYVMRMEGDTCNVLVNGKLSFGVIDELEEYFYDNPEIFDGWDNGRN